MSCIPNGPFKGHAPGDGEIRPLLDRDGLPVIRDGKALEVWGVHHRTRHVLEIYKPSEGWRICIDNAPGPFNLHDPDTYVLGEDGRPRMAEQPTCLFTASLIGPDGQVVATATTLKIINGPAAWEQGESKARSRLYEALGLSRLDDAGETDPDTRPQKDPPAPTEPVSRVPTSVSALPPRGRRNGSSSAATPTPTGESTPPEVPAAEAPPAPPAPTPAPAASDPEVAAPAKGTAKLTPGLLNNATNRARLAGVELPEFTSDEDIRAFLRSLMQKAG